MTSKEMSNQEVVGLFEKVCYVGFNWQEIAETFISRHPDDFGSAIQKVCIAWIAGGPKITKLLDNAKKGKVKDAGAASTLASSVQSITEVKLTPIVKSFPHALLKVRLILVKAGKIPKSDLFRDTALLGWHPDAKLASMELSKSIAMSASTPFNEFVVSSKVGQYEALTKRSSLYEMTSKAFDELEVEKMSFEDIKAMSIKVINRLSSSGSSKLSEDATSPKEGKIKKSS